MPILKSAKKALRQSIRRRARNLSRKNNIRAVLKKIKKLMNAKKVDEAIALLPDAYRALDKAVKHGVIKSNTAARSKSRLAKRLRKLEVN